MTSANAKIRRVVFHLRVAVYGIAWCAPGLLLGGVAVLFVGLVDDNPTLAEVGTLLLTAGGYAAVPYLLLDLADAYRRRKKAR